MTTLEEAAPPAPPTSTRTTWWPEALVVLGALVTNTWMLSRNGWGNSYYAAAARSMTQSWSNFFFASFDPGGWITVDKPPLAFWFQAWFARLFGFSSWSILLPSALAGAATVALLLVTVRRVWGRPAGLVAGAALALTPVAVAVSRSNNPDAFLVLAVVAAAFALERAVALGRFRWLAATGVLIGLGFLAKLSAAFIVLPAFWLAYLLAAATSWRKRILHLIGATAVVLAVCGAWIAAVDLTPASSRPFMGGSTDGTALDVILGYNGLGRVTGNSNGPQGGPGGGARPGGGAGPQGGVGAGDGLGAAGGPGGGFGGGGGPGGFGTTIGGIDQFGGAPGLGRLFNNGMGDQVMWLSVAAAASALGALVLALRRRLTRAQVGSLVVFGGWAVTAYLVFAEASGIFHNYYTSLLAPAVAALVGIGAKLVVDGGRWARTIGGLVVAGSALVQLVFLRRVDALEWLRVVVPVALLVAGAALVATAWLGARAGRWIGLAVGASAGALLIAPAAWSVSSLGHAALGTFPDARPTSTGGFGGAGGPGGGGFPGGGGLSSAELQWLRSQRTSEDWLVAVSSSMQADSAIIGGDSVMAMGGFSGNDPAMTQTRLAELVRAGRLRFVTAGGFGGPGGFGGGGPGGGGPGGASSVTSIVTAACTPVDASAWGGSGTSSLYDCRGQADAILAATPAASAGGAGGAGFPQGGAGAPFDLDALRQCVSEQGLELPDLSQGPPASIDPALQQALTACGVPVP